MSKQQVTEKLYDGLSELLIRYDNSYNHSRVLRAVVEEFEENGWINSTETQSIPDEAVKGLFDSYRWKLELYAEAEREAEEKIERQECDLEHKKAQEA